MAYQVHRHLNASAIAERCTKLGSTLTAVKNGGKDAGLTITSASFILLTIYIHYSARFQVGHADILCGRLRGEGK